MNVYCIIPVYNVEKYLNKCVNSVLCQTYQHITIILVNDASTDSSPAICKKFAQEYPQKIHFIDKPQNEGVDKARFIGLDYVLHTADESLMGGVTFIDSDDYIEPKSIEMMVKAMTDANSDVVQMRANRVLGFIKRPYFSPLEPQTICQPELFDRYYISFFGVNLLDVWMCSKLYNIKVLREANLSASGFKMGEDLIFNLKLFPHYKKYTLIDYRGYNYRLGGLTSGYNPTLWQDLKAQYHLKRIEANTHNYTAAYRTLAIELKNILNTEVSQRIFYLRQSDEDLLKWIENEISDQVLWSDLHHELADYDDATVQAIIAHDALRILEVVKQKDKHNKFKKLLKRMLSIIVK